MRKVTVQQRRAALVRRHRLDGGAADPEAVTDAMVALHATDPASVYLSVLARSTASTLADVSAAMYERRTLVRWLAMRRTLFLFPTATVPVVQAAVSTPLAGSLRRRLLGQLARNGTRPAIEGDPETWLAVLEERVRQALAARGTATGAQLSADEPALRTAIVPRVASDRPQNVTSSLLALMSADGSMVRSTPVGPWTGRQHRWEPVERWWPEGLPAVPVEDAQRTLAQRWLARFGPATVDDLQWWTGWSRTVVRRALDGLPVAEVDLHGGPGLALDGVEQDDDDPASEPVVALLPSLDPTPMGWKHRDWFLSVEAHSVFDRAGNIGPTLWWQGEAIGSWAVAPDGEVRTAIVVDRGAEARDAAEDAAARLRPRLEGTLVTPAIRTTLERSLLD